MDTPISATAPKILENLVAAGLVSHELIGDPARLGTESVALAALCARIAGPVYRLGAFHYAFRAVATDLSGTLGEVEAAGWSAAIEASLATELGEEAVWVSAADFAAEAEAGIDGREILFLKAAGGATAAVLAEAPDLQAVIHAGIAARAAETAATLTASAIKEATRAAGADAAQLADAVVGLSDRVGAVEHDIGTRVETGLTGPVERLSTRIGVLENGIGARIEAAVAVAVAGSVADTVGEAVSGAVSEAVSGMLADTMAREVAREVADAVEGAVGAALRQVVAAVARTSDPAFERIVGAMEVLVGRLADQAARSAEQSARQDVLASGIAALEASVSALREAEAERESEHEAAFAAFEARLGLTLAEFLAQAAPQAGAHVSSARVVEMGREAASFGGAVRAAQLG